MKTIFRVLISLGLVLCLAACAVNTAANITGTNSLIETTAIPSDAANSQVTPVATAAASVTEALAANSQTREDAQDSLWDSGSVVKITLNGDTIRVDGQGTSVEGSQVTISSSGTYDLSGSLADGQIRVDTQDDQVVRLILNGVDIRNSTNAPIYIMNAKRTVIILPEGTQNYLSDSSAYMFADPSVEEPGAAVFSNGDLSIYGNGSLAVQGNFKDGISSDDGLLIAGGNITVNAVDDGLRGKDYLLVKGGILTVNAGGDGLKSDSSEDAESGYILIENGVLNVNADGDGINAQTDALIQAGNFNITTGGGSNSSTGEGTSAKGIKGSASVIIDGGTFTIDAADDALHSNGNILINGGIFQIATGDDGMHADATLAINNGNIHITQSYEGIESAVITLNGGEIHLVASDDGINVAGGADGSGAMPGQPGQPGQRIKPQPGAENNGQPPVIGGFGQDLFASGGDYHLYIHGGYIAIEAAGDGIDSNGTIEMTGGVVLVNGPTEMMNGALDHAGFTLSGGFLVAVGSAGMAQAPSQNSGQNSVLIYFKSIQSAGTLVHIQNSAGEEILTFMPTKEFQSIAFSSPELEADVTYEIYSGGSSTGQMTDSLIQNGTYTPGSAYTNFTVAQAVTTVGSGGRGFQRQ